MDPSQFHFAHPLWFLMLLAIPLVWGLYYFFYRGQQSHHQLEKFIDKHLIPHLLVSGKQKKNKGWTYLLFWSLAWSCLILALAGPRWNYREVATLTRDQSLAILLDLSESMNAKDILPSRLGRAKQKIEDILNMSQGVKIGLIAFAADPHMIAPMTDDKETIRHLLPSLDTDIIYKQGSKLAPALEMASTMLKKEPGNNKSIVVISDGGFEDGSALQTAKKLAEKGIVLHTLGVGTLEGAPLKNRQGIVIKKNGSPIISKLEKEKFQEISKMGNGRYFDANHSEEIAFILEDLEKRSQIQQAQKTQGYWEEHFYLFLLPILPIFLWWFQRGYMFSLLFLILIPTYSQATFSNYFYNADQLANLAYEEGDYATASDSFQDPYRKGVAYYRQGDYASAEKMFRQSSRPEIASSAAYNLGNSLVYQNKLKEAITAYEEVLKKWPDHLQAKENLEIVKKMLEEQKQNQQENSQNQDEKDNNNQEEEKDNSQNDGKEEKSEEQQQKDSESEENGADQTDQQENTKEESSENSQDKEEEQQEEEQQPQEPTLPPEREGETKTPRSQEDLDADLWLNQIKNDPKTFLKNKFYLESKKTGTKEEVDPW